MIEYRKASRDDLDRIWRKNISDNAGDDRWVTWQEEYISYNSDGAGATFVIICDGEPIGEGTLLFSPRCKAVKDRSELADVKTVANINALRIRREYEGQGHISALVALMELYAVQRGYVRLTIGVEAEETRSLAIYLHWGYDQFVMSDIEDDKLVLYYAKNLAEQYAVTS